VVTVHLPGQLRLIREAQRSNGLSAEGDPRRHIGLGDWTGEVPVSIRWYGGSVRTYSLSAGRHHEVRQQCLCRA
jgi:hypothetical protein